MLPQWLREKVTELYIALSITKAKAPSYRQDRFGFYYICILERKWMHLGGRYREYEDICQGSGSAEHLSAEVFL